MIHVISMFVVDLYATVIGYIFNIWHIYRHGTHDSCVPYQRIGSRYSTTDVSALGQESQD